MVLSRLGGATSLGRAVVDVAGMSAIKSFILKTLATEVCDNCQVQSAATRHKTFSRRHGRVGWTGAAADNLSGDAL
jgi:hypothetical protein